MSYQTRNPKAVFSPLRSMPHMQSAEAVFGPSRNTMVRADLHRAEAGIATLRNAYVRAIEALRDANRRPVAWSKKPNRNHQFWTIPRDAASCRRYYQGQALRELNRVRATLRAAERTLAAAQAEAATLTEADLVPLKLVAIRAAQAQRLAA